MKTTCPHCAVHIDIDPETHAALQAQTHFQCPGCNGLVPVPPISAASPQPPSPARAIILAQAHRGLNRNLLILGSAALLVLGGLGFFLASRGGNIFNTEQKITNEIIHNSYFQNLIASGATSRTDLEALAIIRPHGRGFMGISKESLTWKQAQNLAERAGAEIPSTDQSDPSWLGPPEALENSLPALAGTTVWLQERGDARVLDGGNIVVPHTADLSALTRHKVLLHWRHEVSGADPVGQGEWMVLFDGNDLSKWKGSKTPGFPDGAWAVENGALRNLHGTNDQSLVTRESFRDFELEFEWKFSPGGNSGIFYGIREFQLVDDVGNPNGKIPVTSCGALCYFIAPNLQPVGEFNRGRLAVSGNHVEHWINGEKVVEYELGSPALKSLVAAGQFRNLPGYKEVDTEAGETPVSLQSHGGTVWFRNIRIRSLDSAYKPVHLFILSGQSNMARMDPNAGLVPEAARIFPGAEVIYFKVASGGKPIRLWVSEWNEIADKHGLDTKIAGSGEGDDGTLFYKPIVAQYKALVGKHSKPASVTFCWMQGESDAGNFSAAYLDAMQQLIANLRRDIEQPAMNFVIGRISDVGKADDMSWAAVRAAQVAVAESDPHGAWVDCDDLNDTEKEGVKRDDLHYTKEGYILLGQRYARQAKALIDGKMPAANGRPE